MKSISSQMIDKSLSAMMSAIEIYNKPDFKYREEAFVVLAVNAWELLFKAKILVDNKNKQRSIQAFRDGELKRTRYGNPMTIDVFAAMRKIDLDAAFHENINALVEMRDTATHYVHTSEIKYIIFSLGIAMLKNYQKLILKWFGRSLKEYNLFIMPLAFMHDFKSIETLDEGKSRSVASNIIRSVNSAYKNIIHSGEFEFVCEIKAELTKTKLAKGETDVTVRIDPTDPNARLALTINKSKLDQYPLSYRELVAKVQKAKPQVRNTHIDKIIKDHKIKDNKKFAEYSFRTKQQDERYRESKVIPLGTSSIYNESAVMFIINEI